MNVIELHRPSAHVAEVWLNRPDVRNAFNEELIGALTQTFASLSVEPDLRVIVLGARGKAFCAGADLNWMRAMADYSWEQNRADAQKLADMLWTLDQCPVPIVGRVQGDCYAGTISPYVIRALGVQASRRYMVTAERFSAAQAHALDFVHTLCTTEQLNSEVAALVATLVANGPLATRACKLLVRDVSAAPMSEALRADTARRIADIRASDEGKEGLQSFLHKRPPTWLV